MKRCLILTRSLRALKYMGSISALAREYPSGSLDALIIHCFTGIIPSLHSLSIPYHCFHFPHLFSTKDPMPWSLFFECWVLSQPFHSPLSLSSRGCLVPLSTIRVLSSAYLRLLIFLPAILIPACYPSKLAFQVIYSAYKLNKQGDNIQPCHTPFPILNQSVPYKVLTIASWHAYRFLRRQVRWSDIPICLRIFQFVMIHTVKGFIIVNEDKVDVFLEFPCFFYDPTNVGNLISGSSAFSKSSLYIWKF